MEAVMWQLSRACKTCGKRKANGEFPRYVKGYSRYKCKTCTSEMKRRHRKNGRVNYTPDGAAITCTTCGVTRSALCHTPGKTSRYGRASKCRVCDSRRTRARKYGVSQSELIDIEKIDACQICGKEVEHQKYDGYFLAGATACLDHCHESGLVRGVLCHRCNNLLGIACDDVSIMGRAIDYLKNPPLQNGSTP